MSGTTVPGSGLISREISLKILNVPSISKIIGTGIELSRLEFLTILLHTPFLTAFSLLFATSSFRGGRNMLSGGFPTRFEIFFSSLRYVIVSGTRTGFFVRIVSNRKAAVYTGTIPIYIPFEGSLMLSLPGAPFDGRDTSFITYSKILN